MSVNEKKLKKKSELEKSFKISGIKMFNPELTPRSGGVPSLRNSASRNINVDKLRKSLDKFVELPIQAATN